ncbi:MAG: hypothetical protein KVP17_001029 [Porospora cf. gigantea B]|uniref:uncharacterized protein n=1 Tax=Porospora cf. gigantea B TaxID=2853592 RepID=UPI003571ADCC|nr:MAG: hypothetical protein KVP17_001029 [Porospora cf. gigantea B]
MLTQPAPSRAATAVIAISMGIQVQEVVDPSTGEKRLALQFPPLEHSGFQDAAESGQYQQWIPQEMVPQQMTQQMMPQEMTQQMMPQEMTQQMMPQAIMQQMIPPAIRQQMIPQGIMKQIIPQSGQPATSYNQGVPSAVEEKLKRRIRRLKRRAKRMARLAERQKFSGRRPSEPQVREPPQARLRRRRRPRKAEPSVSDESESDESLKDVLSPKRPFNRSKRDVLAALSKTGLRKQVVRPDTHFGFNGFSGADYLGERGHQFMAPLPQSRPTPARLPPKALPSEDMPARDDSRPNLSPIDSELLEPNVLRGETIRQAERRRVGSSGKRAEAQRTV